MRLAWMVEEAKTHGLLVNTAMFNHLVLGKPRQGQSRNYVAPDACAKLHNSMTIGWRLLEWIPKRVSLREGSSRKAFLGFYIPLGEPRVISTNDLVHYSVFERFRADPDYRPINLPSEESLCVVREPDWRMTRLRCSSFGQTIAAWPPIGRHSPSPPLR
jgi:hypothetical protein